MKRTTTVSTLAALSLLLALPAWARDPGNSTATRAGSGTMSPSNIGDVSSTGQSLRYKRPRKRRHTRTSPTDIGNISRTRRSLRYSGSHRRSTSRRHARRSSHSSRSSSR